MVTPKPAFGHNKSYALPIYNPSESEMEIIVGKIESIIGRKVTQKFRKTVWQLITILRARIDIDNNLPNLDNILVEIDRVDRLLKEVKRIFDSETGINQFTMSAYFQEFIKRNETDHKDPIVNLCYWSSHLLEINKSMKENQLTSKKQLKNGKFGTLTKLRQVVIEEFARAFDDELNIKPTKTRGGKFDKCLHILLASIACTINGRKVSIIIPDDTFDIIRRAIDTYPNKPKLSFLEVKKFPGLSG